MGHDSGSNLISKPSKILASAKPSHLALLKTRWYLEKLRIDANPIIRNTLLIRRGPRHNMAPNMFWVYILQCSDSSYYTGHTDNLEARLYQHYHKIFPTCYTATRLPVKLAYSAQFPSRIEALKAEKQIQGWSRKKKEALISGDWEKLSFLARRNKK